MKSRKFSLQTSKTPLDKIRGHSLTSSSQIHIYVGMALLVRVGGGLLKRVLYFFGNEPSLGQKSPILHLPPNSMH